MLNLTLALAVASAQGVGANPGATLIDRTRTDRVAPQPMVRKTKAPATAATAVMTQAPDVTIAGVRFTGAEAPARVAGAARRFLGRKATSATLTELAAALAAAYRKTEVALYTVAIPGQDFAGGVVTVALIEGRIAGVDFGAPAGPQLRARLTPLTQETPLTRATFERQLLLARAIPGLTLGTDLTDPAGDGALRLKVTPQQKRHKFTTGYTSRGVDLLGAGQLTATGEVYGAFVNGDQLSANLAAAPDLKRYRLATAGYAAPVGTNGAALGLSGAYLETRPRRRTGKGIAKQVAATFNYPVLRSFTRTADLTASLDGIDNKDATIAGIVAREQSRAARLSASYAVNGERRSWSVAATGSRGLGWLGATSPDSETRFTKISLNAAVAQRVGKRLTARANVSGQFSRDRLPVVERFAIGGEAIGRGFDESILAGDRGAGGLAELGWQPIGKGRFANSELYGFIDGGRVRIAARGPFAAQSFDLASAGVGTRIRRGDKAELGLEAARVIDRPYPAYADKWQFTASWRLQL
jgi:hemolysin activation/secretion protein